jgi:hypothetical protein
MARLGIWRATLIQNDRSLDSIIANVLLVGDFIDSIGHDPPNERM